MRDQRRGAEASTSPASGTGRVRILLAAAAFALFCAGPIAAAEEGSQAAPAPTAATTPPTEKNPAETKPVEKKTAAPAAKASEAKSLPPPRLKVSADNPARFPSDI